MLATTFLFCLAGKIKTQTCKNLTTLYAVASLWIIKWLTLNQGAGAGGGKGKVCVNPLAGEHSRLVDKVEKEEVSAKEDQGPEAQEAWHVPQEERSNESYLPILVTIGKFLFVCCK